MSNSSHHPLLENKQKLSSQNKKDNKNHKTANFEFDDFLFCFNQGKISIGRLACHDHINKLIKQALGSAAARHH